MSPRRIEGGWKCFSYSVAHGRKTFCPTVPFPEREHTMDQHVEVSIEGRLLLPTGLTNGCIGMTGGRIVAIKKILEGETH
ncbi:MAG: hypothetical protein LN414_00250, partial [Candidatus Thermoplasmatota archaeon]|nr:hypothetical protein [Candidatus Thermoplasmatota archaeon]